MLAAAPSWLASYSSRWHGPTVDESATMPGFTRRLAGRFDRREREATISG